MDEINAAKEDKLRRGLLAKWQMLPPVSYTHLRAHETGRNLVCRLLLEKKKTQQKHKKKKKQEVKKKKKQKKEGNDDPIKSLN